jgi:hypothetical protein
MKGAPMLWCLVDSSLVVTCFRFARHESVLEDLARKNISIRVASPKLVMEESPSSYKNVIDVSYASL